MVYIQACLAYIRLYLYRGELRRDETTHLLKDWTGKLDLRWVSTLLSTLRGCDGCNSNSKKVTRMLRYLITNEVGKKSSYMSDQVHSTRYTVDVLLKEYITNQHWVEHVLSAAYVIYNNHPDPYVRAYWLTTSKVANTGIRKLVKAETARKARVELQNRIISKYYEIYMFRGI